MTDLSAGRHDAGERRKSSRKQRERGCSIYIAAEELKNAGIDPYGPPPLFRVYPGRKRTLLVQLYEAPSRSTEGSTE